MRSFARPSERLPAKDFEQAPLRMLRAVRRAALFSLAFTLIGCCHEDSASRPVGAGAAPSVSGNTSTSNGAEEKLVPYDDILRYPSDWPGISQRRSAAN
jgi:hypothetical protein